MCGTPSPRTDWSGHLARSEAAGASTARPYATHRVRSDSFMLISADKVRIRCQTAQSSGPRLFDEVVVPLDRPIPLTDNGRQLLLPKNRIGCDLRMARLLLVDDDPGLIAEQVRSAFPASAHRIDVARTGEE